MYGIDPDVTHLWTPERFRLGKEGWQEALDAIWPGADKIKDPAAKKAFQVAYAKLEKDFADIPDRIKEGAPVVEIKCLLEKFSIRLGKAKAVYEGQLKLARDRLAKAKEAIEAESLTEPEKLAKIQDVERIAEEQNIARGVAVYDDALISEIVRAVTVSINDPNGDLIPGWEMDLFRDILDMNAFEKREVESFTSARDSGQG